MVLNSHRNHKAYYGRRCRWLGSPLINMPTKRPLSGQQKENQSGSDGCEITNSLLLISYDCNVAVFMNEKVA